MKTIKMGDNIKGMTLALLIIGVWSAGLFFLLTLKTAEISWFLILLGIIWQTFLYTGLFITAHDAMHGTVFPTNRKMNDFIGNLAIKLYALFSYSGLLKKHWEHHRHPASSQDPDFHDGTHRGFFPWYIHFMSNYLSWKQVVGMAIAFNIFIYIFQINTINLILFWILPSFLSTIQLFYFGTYLPHRERAEPFPDEHRARSNDYGIWWSFFTCYHFGYHWEHHEYAHIPWWQLPNVRRMILAKIRDS